MGEGVRLSAVLPKEFPKATLETFMGPVKGFPRVTLAGEYVYEVAHGQGGRKLFRESELATW